MFKVKRCFSEVALSRRSFFKVLNGQMDINSESYQNAKSKSDIILSALKCLTSIAEKGGGSKAVYRHTEINKKILVRDRIKLLFDQNSHLFEIGLFAGMAMDYGNIPCAGSVAVIGKIHNHYCLVGANDATVKGGTFFPITVSKQIRLQHIALLNQLPCIYLVDSGGAFLPLQADIFPDKEHGGRTFYNEAILSSLGIPQVALVCGSSTAGGAYCPTMAEEAIIVEKTGIIFLGGPPLVKAATGEVISEQDLGGAEMHCSISGCTDYFAETEATAFEMCRESIAAMNLPDNPIPMMFQEPLYPNSDLNTISGKDILTRNDLYMILARILDGSKFKEFKQRFGSNLITGFGFICGKLVGLLCNCGDISSPDAQKGAHFIELCENRNIPLVFLQNSGERLSEEISLSGNKLKDRAKMTSAHATANVTKIAINIKGCSGDENFTMCGIGFEPNFVLSWPLAITSFEEMPQENLLENITLGDTDSYMKLFECTTSPFFISSRMWIDAVISPSETRQILGLCLDIACSKTSHASGFRQKRHNSVLRM